MTMLSAAADSSQSAEQEAYAYVHRGLRHGRWRAGDRLIAEDIAAELGMSRMPVREAFRRLAADGLVLLRPNRGCVVAGLTLEEIYETFEIRSVLEGLAVRLAMPRIDLAVIGELRALLDGMERAGASGGDWVGRHQAFHAYVCELSGRPKLVRQIAGLHVVLEPYMRIWFDLVEKPLSAREEHESLIEALASGDARRAEAAMQEHILGTAPLLADYASPGPRR
jgi:DNA-binding GntR family transcriptional regulator